MTGFHERLRKAYEASDMTIKELSTKDVSNRTIENWISGKKPTMPKIDQIADVAKKLNVSLEYLAYGNDDSTTFNAATLLGLARKHEKMLTMIDALPKDKLEFLKLQVESVYAHYSADSSMAAEPKTVYGSNPRR